ncbi:MAG: tRNA (adenosine(37)-N6)-threonylcarbamoyltransferase complex dimerization subunit type 1 TsaB [Spirochaetaceae bacterium]|jgi:tRNA threonylcarbamoyladenosine biosynthesis protein TsaB|nr:tRNA (adenosine(37)-N6)-threonylcarbamoyltransferase complex dimerization subunit type 1 TsaB [Spirochaetaceae bacterium]
MNILAIDTATSLLSVAVSSPQGIRQFDADAGLRHSELLLEVIDYLVRSSGLDVKDLELAACMQGPGSFTGIRIGFAAAKGVALACGIPLIAAPTLDCIASPAGIWPGIVIPAIDAKQKRFFTAIYRQNERLTDYMDADAGEIARAVLACAARPGTAPSGTAGEASTAPPVLVTGPDSALLAPLLAEFLGKNRLVLDPASRKGKSRELLEFSQKKYIMNKKGESSFEEPAPVYLRKSDAEVKFGRLRPE